MEPKVLIGCVTYDGHKYCIEQFLHNFEKFTYKNFDVVFVDNSEKDEYGEIIEKHKFKVIKDKSEKEKIKKIVNGRKIIRKYALKNNYDYLLFLDTDVLIPSKALERLLGHRKDVISGVYLSNFVFDEKQEIHPVLYAIVPGNDEGARLMQQKEVGGEELIEIAACGLGCCLISKKVLEKVDIRYFEKSNSGEDIAFCVDARKNKFKIFTDTSIKCLHMAYPLDDERINFFKFRRNTDYSFDVSLG